MAKTPRFRKTVAQVVAEYRSGAFARMSVGDQIAIWCETFSPEGMLPALTVQGLEALAQILDLGLPGFADLNVLFKQQYGDICWNSILIFSDEDPFTWTIAFSGLSTDHEFEPTWPTVDKGCFVRTPETGFTYGLSWNEALDVWRRRTQLAA